MLQALVRLEALLRDDLGVAHVAVFWIAELLIVFVVGLVSLSGQELLAMSVLHFDNVFIFTRQLLGFVVAMNACYGSGDLSSRTTAGTSAPWVQG